MKFNVDVAAFLERLVDGGFPIYFSKATGFPIAKKSR